MMSETVNDGINERIKLVRTSLNMTQKEFGEIIGLKQNTVSLIEKKRNTSDQTIYAICREFNVNEEWLRTGNGNMAAGKSNAALKALVAEYGLNNETYIAIEKFINLKPSLRAGILTYFKEVAAAIRDTESCDQIPKANDNMEIDTVSAEAAYEKSLRSARKTDSCASSTIGDTERVG